MRRIESESCRARDSLPDVPQRSAVAGTVGAREMHRPPLAVFVASCCVALLRCSSADSGGGSIDAGDPCHGGFFTGDPCTAEGYVCVPEGDCAFGRVRLEYVCTMGQWVLNGKTVDVC